MNWDKVGKYTMIHMTLVRQTLVTTRMFTFNFSSLTPEHQTSSIWDFFIANSHCLNVQGLTCKNFIC